MSGVDLGVSFSASIAGVSRAKSIIYLLVCVPSINQLLKFGLITSELFLF